jgi:hypothetical protein
MTDDLSVEAKGTREVPVLELKGELDLASAELLETAVERLAPWGAQTGSHAAASYSTAGSGTTTINADSQPSATNPRSPEPTCSGLTARALIC